MAAPEQLAEFIKSWIADRLTLFYIFNGRSYQLSDLFEHHGCYKCLLEGEIDLLDLAKAICEAQAHPNFMFNRPE